MDGSLHMRHTVAYQQSAWLAKRRLLIPRLVELRVSGDNAMVTVEMPLE